MVGGLAEEEGGVPEVEAEDKVAPTVGAKSEAWEGRPVD